MGAEPAKARALRTGRIGRLLIVVNRRAGTVQRQPQLPDTLRRIVGQRGDVVAPTDRDELLRSISRGRAQGVDTIAMCGGDGTNLAIATAIATVYRDTAWPRLVMLSGGTLNTVARNLGCAVPAPAMLANLLACEAPEVLRQPMLQVNEHTGFIFGSHMVARVLEVYYAGVKTVGGAMVLTSRIVGSAAVGSAFSRDLFRAEAARVSVDGQPPTAQPFTCLMASTVPSPALGIRAMPRAGEGGGFHLIGTQQSPSRIFREAGRVFAGLPLQAMSTDVVAHEATVTFDNESRFTVDGDLFAAQRVTLQATACVDILVPAIA